MSKLARALCLGLLASAASIGTASAQYYPPGPPGGPPGYAPPPPPPGYYPPRGYYRERPPGERCQALVRSPYGRQEVICELYRPRPVGEPCGCPAPRPPPGYPPGPDARGRVIP